MDQQNKTKHLRGLRSVRRPAGAQPVFIGAGNDRQFSQFADVLGITELADDARLSTNADRVRNVAELRPLIIERIAQRRRHELRTGESREPSLTPRHEHSHRWDAVVGDRGRPL
ncbi:CoA transferase [Saccharopolyspora sp. NPDC000995]